MRAEVRCCCDAGLLLGHVQLDRPYIREGDVIAFVLRPTVSLRPFWEQRDDALLQVTPRQELRLTVAFANGMDRRTGAYFSGLAIKSNDTPIETLRRIVGFEEAR